jgi:hypothetical protein
MIFKSPLEHEPIAIDHRDFTTSSIVCQSFNIRIEDWSDRFFWQLLTAAENCVRLTYRWGLGKLEVDRLPSFHGAELKLSIVPST